MTANVSAEIAHTPAASPSSPSMKLTMLMIVATQRTVSGMEMAGCRVTVMLVSGTDR